MNVKRGETECFPQLIKSLTPEKPDICELDTFDIYELNAIVLSNKNRDVSVFIKNLFGNVLAESKGKSGLNNVKYNVNISRDKYTCPLYDYEICVKNNGWRPVNVDEILTSQCKIRKYDVEKPYKMPLWLKCIGSMMVISGLINMAMNHIHNKNIPQPS